MIPVPAPPGPTALVTSAASSSGCPLSSAQCLVSYNWGGYAVCVPQAACSADAAASGSVTDVKGSWVVPAIVGAQRDSCSDSQKTWYDASVWVGIDGFVSPTVEQTGTSSDCYYGQVYYYAWYEFYPANSVTITSLTVRPGDIMTAEVSYSKGLFTTTIEDMNTRQSYTSPPTAVPGAETDSAEWIVESADYNGILALTPVSQVTFTGATATINGATRTIAGWGSDAYWLLMVDYNWGFNAELGVATPHTQTLAYAKADTSALGRAGGSFSVNWLSSGP
jgi:Peptidase A4 family